MSLVYYVEDDADIRNLVVYTLNMMGFKARGFESVVPFRAALAEKTPDLVLLDVMLPGESGMDILQELKLKPRTAKIPAMMITARDGEDDKVNGLDFGADDYISKPFSVMELVARVRAVLRRCSTPKPAGTLRFGEILLDIDRHSVCAGNEEIQLTLKEFTLLRILMENSGRLVERETLIEELWGGDCENASHTLDAHMRTLRSKLGESGCCIQTVYGRGYRLRAGE